MDDTGKNESYGAGCYIAALLGLAGLAGFFLTMLSSAVPGY